MDSNESPRKPSPIMVVINIGLSFLMPFVCLVVLLTGAHAYFRGYGRFQEDSLIFLGIIGVSVVVGILNAAGYYRKIYQG